MTRYVVVSNKSDTSHTLARQRAGTDDYVALATFTDRATARKTAALLNKEEDCVQGKSEQG